MAARGPAPAWEQEEPRARVPSIDLDRRTLIIGLSLVALVALAVGATAWATAGESSRKGYAAATFGCLGFSVAALLFSAIVFAVNWAHLNGGGWLGLVWRYPLAVIGVSYSPSCSASNLGPATLDTSETRSRSRTAR